MQNDPANQKSAIALADWIQNQEYFDSGRSEASVAPRTIFRLSMMATLAAQEVEDMRIEIEQLKDENATLQKQLIPGGL